MARGLLEVRVVKAGGAMRPPRQEEAPKTHALAPSRGSGDRHRAMPFCSLCVPIVSGT